MAELLCRLGWSQAYFAGLLGVSKKTVSRWCGGRSGGPGYVVGVRYLELVARVLGV